MAGAISGARSSCARRCSAFAFFLHPAHSPPEFADAPQEHCRCRVPKDVGVSDRAAAAGLIGIWVRVLIQFSLITQTNLRKAMETPVSEAERSARTSECLSASTS